MKEKFWATTLELDKADEPKTMADATLHRLSRDIMSGRLQAGQKLRIQELTKSYEVGSSPVREALFQLAKDGLVKSESQRGFTVADFSIEELRDITEWSAHLECLALERAIQFGDVQWEANAMATFHCLKRIEQTNESESEAADYWEKLHTNFHFALYRACNSPWLLRFCELLGRHAQRYRRSFVKERCITPEIMQEHEAILNAAIARDAPKAVALLQAHILQASDLARKSLSL